MPFSRTMIAVLLGISLSVGVLFALVVTERNAARDQLKTANTSLDEKKEDLQSVRIERDDFKMKFNGCEASLSQQNIYISQMQQTLIAAGQDAVDRADKTLSTLPAQIQQDREATALDPLNKWMRELFK